MFIAKHNTLSIKGTGQVAPFTTEDTGFGVRGGLDTLLPYHIIFG